MSHISGETVEALFCLTECKAPDDAIVCIAFDDNPQDCSSDHGKEWQEVEAWGTSGVGCSIRMLVMNADDEEEFTEAELWWILAFIATVVLAIVVYYGKS